MIQVVQFSSLPIITSAASIACLISDSMGLVMAEVNPAAMAIALIFPGQGSQDVGMGAALAETYPAAARVFEEVDDALKQNLSRLMFEGPDDELRLTENAQPGLMAVSMAVVAVLERQDRDPG